MCATSGSAIIYWNPLMNNSNRKCVTTIYGEPSLRQTHVVLSPLSPSTKQNVCAFISLSGQKKQATIQTQDSEKSQWLPCLRWPSVRYCDSKSSPHLSKPHSGDWCLQSLATESVSTAQAHNPGPLQSKLQHTLHTPAVIFTTTQHASASPKHPTGYSLATLTSP